MSDASTIETGPRLPQDVELEQAVLGCCLAYPDKVDEVFAHCAPEDFYFAPNDALAEAIFALHQEQVPVTVLSVGARLSGSTALAELGGKEYLNSIRLAAPTGSVAVHARTLAEFRMRRNLMEAAEQSREALAHPGIAVMEALRPVLGASDMVAEALGRRQAVPIRQAAETMLRRAEDRANGNHVVAATTGVSALDKAIGGLQGGDLIVMAGRPGMGKSALLFASALRTAMQGRPVIAFSLEMTLERLLQRMGADLDYDRHPANPMSYSWFRNGTAKHADIARLAEAVATIPDNLSIIENGSLTIHEIAAMSRAYAARKQGMGLVVIDYLQKVSAGDRYRGNRVQEVTEISGAAKALAMRLGWPVLVGAQLSRAVESRDEKRPNLTDLRESGSIEQDADAVIGLYRPAYYIEKRKPALGTADPAWDAWDAEWQSEKNRLDLLVLKNRNGAEDSLSVFCDMRASAIRDEKPRGAA